MYSRKIKHGSAARRPNSNIGTNNRNRKASHAPTKSIALDSVISGSASGSPFSIDRAPFGIQKGLRNPSGINPPRSGSEAHWYIARTVSKTNSPLLIDLLADGPRPFGLTMRPARKADTESRNSRLTREANGNLPTMSGC